MSTVLCRLGVLVRVGTGSPAGDRAPPTAASGRGRPDRDRCAARRSSTSDVSFQDCPASDEAHRLRLASLETASQVVVRFLGLVAAVDGVLVPALLRPHVTRTFGRRKDKHP